MSKEPKSEQMVKSMVAQLAGQAVSIFLQSKEEQRESEAEYAQGLDWLKMEKEDLQERIEFLETKLKEETESKEVYQRFWHECLESRDRLRDQIKKLVSDAATSDREVLGEN